MSLYSEWENKFDKLPSFTQKVISESLLNRSFELYIDPTEKCNFRCSYCYERFIGNKMSKETLGRVKKLIERTMPGRKKLYLNWFGGEPLLASSVIYELSEWATNYCATNDIELIGSMTTNGYQLDRSTLLRLTEANISFFQISFDGDKEEHDQVRLRADGRGTFDVIWDNLRTAKEQTSDFLILIRIHLRKDNFKSVRRLLRKIRLEFEQDKRFTVGLFPLENLGGPNKNEVGKITLTGDIFDQWCEELSSEVAYLTNMRAENISFPGEESCGAAVCYACKNNAYHIRSDGRVGKCTVALDADFNALGYVGENGQLIIDRSKEKRWSAGMISLEKQALECPLSKGKEYFVEKPGA